MKNLGLDNVVLVAPEKFERMDVTSAQGYFKAEQRVMNALDEGLIKRGEEQLQAKSGFDNDKLPAESPVETTFALDDISFKVETSARVNNPKYQTAFDQIAGFLEVVANDWKSGVRKDGIRTHDGQPFVELGYLMRNVTWYTSRVTNLGVKNSLIDVSAPAELDGVSRAADSRG